MFWEVLVATVPLGVLAVAFESGRSVQWQLPAVLCVLYSGSLATAFAYWASQSIQRTLAPMATAVSLLAVPVVGIVTGAVVLGEKISLGDLIGFAITFIGIATLSLFGDQQLQVHQTPVEH
jgi:drug/metabolite transporter (DMT)-like permease